ncbi:hypothetical protein Z949_2745 [Sulfitobacter guttiformis KCTC 32187]|nr:hypothetical protein Z949_2745 [Sulfitobacter guttiformis KCTC 32187]
MTQAPHLSYHPFDPLTKLTSKIPELKHCHGFRFVDGVKCHVANALAG